MNELKDKLAALGLSESQIQGALQAVGDFVKGKVPENYQGAIDALMKGETPDWSSMAGGLLDQVKGFWK